MAQQPPHVIPSIYLANYLNDFEPLFPRYGVTLLAPGDRDHILSGVFNQFLSALTEPVE